MAISRPFLLALLGVALLGATFFAVQNARDASTGDPAPAVQPAAPEQQAAAPSQPTPALSAKDALEAAFDPGQLFKSAFDLSVSTRGGGERAALEISGAFERGAPNDLPAVEVDVRGTASGQRFGGGFVAVEDAAYFTQGDKAWRVPEQVWDPLVTAAANGQSVPVEELSTPFEPRRWVTRTEVEGSETVDGVETTHLSASVNPARVVRDLRTVPGFDLPGGAALPRGSADAKLDVWVATEDRIVRRMNLEMSAGKARERSVVAIDFRLTGVNQPQDIEAPADVSPGRPGGLLGVFAEGFVGGLSSAGGGQPISLAALTSRNPRKAARAVADHKKVAILFRNPRGLDDRVMSRVMDEVGRRTQAVVLSDHVDAVERYGEMVETLGVSQTPSVVLIDRAGEARLIEGYVDADTLAQAVADAR